MNRLIKLIAAAIGTGSRAFVALVGVAGITAAVANYAMTQGVGTNFGSIVVSTVHYAQQLICDPTTPANCGAVKAGNSAGTTDVAQVVTDPNVLAAVQAAVPAGTNLIGKVGIDQTTPGTTNLVALAANQSVNVAQVNGVTTSTGTGAVGTGTQRVAVGTDTATVAGSTPAAAGLGATGSAVPSGAQLAGVLDAAGGTNMLGLAGDPCQTSVKTTVLFTLATAAVKVAITGVSAKKIYVCQYYLNNNAADSVAIFEATTATTCATAAGALIGAGTSVATAAQGNNWAANGGVSIGNGAAQVLSTLTNAADLCIAQSAATQLSGSFTYVTR